jgi:hypothetical protein
MNTLFDFYWEVLKYLQESRRDERWVIEITSELMEGIDPTWKPDREKLEALDVAYHREIKNEDDLATIKAFVEAAQTDLAKDEDKKVQNLLLEISAPKHLATVLQ